MPYQLYHLITPGVQVLYTVEMKKKVIKELLDWQSKGHSFHNSLKGRGHRNKFIQIVRISCFFRNSLFSSGFGVYFHNYFLLSSQRTMIKKKQFVELLYSALDTEEGITGHFYKYTADSLKYYKWLSEDKKNHISEITTKLRNDCGRHKNMVEKLIKYVQESEKNVF